MNYNTDGFNDRRIYVMNSNNHNHASNFDNSFAKMRTEERRGLVQTTDSSNTIKPVEETRGNKENFVVQNSHINGFNKPMNQNNPVARAMNNNLFKKTS